MMYPSSFLKRLDKIIHNYATLDKLDGFFDLAIDDIPDFDLYELSALLMSDDEYASESTGPDNPQFYRSMMPSLISHMKDISNQDKAIEFVNAWRDGIAKYHRECIQDVLVERLDEYNQEMKFGDKGIRPWAA